MTREEKIDVCSRRVAEIMRDAGLMTEESYNWLADDSDALLAFVFGMTEMIVDVGNKVRKGELNLSNFEEIQEYAHQKLFDAANNYDDFLNDRVAKPELKVVGGEGS